MASAGVDVIPRPPRARFASLLLVVALLGCDRLKSNPVGGGDEGGILAQGLSFVTGGKFEGEITSELTLKKGTKGLGGKPSDVVFGIKSPKVRVDGVGGIDKNDSIAPDSWLLLDPVEKKGWLVSATRKQALVAAFDKNQPLRFTGKPPSGTPPVPDAPPKIDKTGVKSVVAGYECEEWKLTSKKSRADVCVAEGITWIDLSDSFEWPELSVAAVVAEANRFPLRAVVYDEKNVETARLVAKKVEKKPLDAARFVVPAGFQVVDLQSLPAPKK